MSKVCLDAARLPPSFPSSPTTPHMVAGWCPSCIWSGMRYECGRQQLFQCVGVRLRIKAHFHYGCALRCVAWREIQRCGRCFYFSRHATSRNATHSRRNRSKPL